MLRAQFLARVAVDACACALFFLEHKLVAELCRAQIVVGVGVVKEIKVDRDVYAVGAWHAVTALRAGNRNPCFVLFADLRNQLLVRFAEFAHTRRIGEAQVLRDLVHRAHAA